jgi:uncharacterized protein
MSQSLLLQLARQSIQEVLEAERFIDKASLIDEYPILSQPVAVGITIYLGQKIRAHFCTLEADRPLIDAIIYNAKVAAFELPQYPPLSTSEYLHVSIELSLLSPLQRLEAPSLEALYERITPERDGIVIKHDNKSAYFMPENWDQERQVATVINRLHEALHVSPDMSNAAIELYTFQTEKAKDTPIVSH